MKFKEKMAGKDQPAAAPAVADETLNVAPGFGFGSFFASAVAVTTTTTAAEVSCMKIMFHYLRRW